MSEKSKAPLIFGVAAILAGGGLYYFFKIYQPKQARGKAQQEIAQWEERLDKVRACLLGPTPASGKAGEALAVRELAPDIWDRKTCTQLVAKLSRGIAEDTGMMDVEHAWMTIDRAAAKVATAFASHVDPLGEEPDKRGKESPLPGALDELEAAHAELRASAKMDPPASASQAALPEAETIALVEGKDRVSTLTAWLIPSSGGVLAFGSIKDKGEVQLALTAGAAPKVLPIPSGAVRAVPDLAWGAAGLREETAIGTIDPRGAFGQMTSLPVKMGARVGVAVGTFANGFVAYDSANQLVFARSQNGAFTADKPREVGRISFAMDPAGRGFVAWTDGTGAAEGDEGKLVGLIVKDGAPATPHTLGSGWPSGSCLTATGAWVGSQDQQFISFDGTDAVPHALPEHALLGCSATGALFYRYGSTHFTACTNECRAVDMTALRPTNIAALAGDKVVALRTRDRVIGLWSEGQPPKFFAMQKPLTPTLAYSDGKVVDVLGDSEDGVVVVRLPLK